MYFKYDRFKGKYAYASTDTGLRANMLMLALMP